MAEGSKRSERVTYEEVVNICDLLSELDIEITQAKIYSLLKRGSNTTLSKFINQWRSEQKNSPVKLKRSIVRAIESEIERESSIITQHATTMASEAKTQAEKVTAENKRLKELVLRQEEEIKTLKASHHEEIRKLETQIEAEKLEKSSFMEKAEIKSELYIEATNLSTANSAKIDELHKSNKKFEKEIASIRKEKEELLIENGKLQAQLESRDK